MNTEELLSMKHRMDSMEDKLDKLDKKMDMLTERLLDPDHGVTSRVNRNTSYRKILTKAVWILYALATGAIVSMIF